MADLEMNDGRRSKTKKKGKKGKRSKKDQDEKGALQDIALPENFKEYGVPTDVGKRILNFSDVDKSVFEGITEMPYCPTPWNFVCASMSIFLILISVYFKV